MAKRFHGNYESMEGKRAMESSDGAMIPSGQGNFANMPTEVVMKMYPSQGSFLGENLNDKMSGIDHQVNTGDKGKMRSHLSPEKV